MRIPALIAAFLLVSPVAGFPHGGGLDSLGCHNDRKNGGYHCHRGPLAGQSFGSKAEALKALEKQKQQQPATGKQQKAPDKK